MKCTVQQTALKGVLTNALALHKEPGVGLSQEYFAALRRSGDGELTINIIDAPTHMEVNLPAAFEDWDMDAGFCIPKAEVQKFISFGNDKEVVIAHEKGAVTVQCDRSRLRTRSISLDSFAMMRDVMAKSIIHTTVLYMKSAFEFTVGCIPASGKNGQRITVFLVGEAGETVMHVVSSDQTRLSHVEFHLEERLSDKVVVAMPIQSAQFLAKFMKSVPDDEVVEITADENAFRMRGSDWVFQSQLEQSAVMPWERYINAKSEAIIELQTSSAKRAVSEAATVADEGRFGAITFRTENGAVCCSAEGERGAVDSVAEGHTYMEDEFCLSADGVKGFLSALEKNGVDTASIDKINSASSDAPILFSSNAINRPRLVMAQRRKVEAE